MEPARIWAGGEASLTCQPPSALSSRLPSRCRWAKQSQASIVKNSSYHHTFRSSSHAQAKPKMAATPGLDYSSRDVELSNIFTGLTSESQETIAEATTTCNLYHYIRLSRPPTWSLASPEGRPLALRPSTKSEYLWCRNDQFVFPSGCRSR